MGHSIGVPWWRYRSDRNNYPILNQCSDWLRGNYGSKQSSIAHVIGLSNEVDVGAKPEKHAYRADDAQCGCDEAAEGGHDRPARRLEVDLSLRTGDWRDVDCID